MAGEAAFKSPEPECEVNVCCTVIMADHEPHALKKLHVQKPEMTMLRILDLSAEKHFSSTSSSLGYF